LSQQLELVFHRCMVPRRKHTVCPSETCPFFQRTEPSRHQLAKIISVEHGYVGLTVDTIILKDLCRLVQSLLLDHRQPGGTRRSRIRIRTCSKSMFVFKPNVRPCAVKTLQNIEALKNRHVDFIGGRKPNPPKKNDMSIFNRTSLSKIQISDLFIFEKYAFQRSEII
jgi:hypothetical protein